jgi:hypothetical protein
MQEKTSRLSLIHFHVLLSNKVYEVWVVLLQAAIFLRYIYSLKDSRCWLFFFNEKRRLQKKLLPSIFFCACNFVER